MKPILRRTVVVAIVAFAVTALCAWRPASAQPGVTGGGLKIGVVDLGKLGDALDEAKAINAQLKAKHDESQKKLDEVVDQLKAVQNDLKLETDHNGVHWRELLVKAKELEMLARARKDALEQVFDFEKGMVTADMYARIADGVNLYAVQEGFDLVLVDDHGLTPPRDQGSAAAGQYIQSRHVMFASKRLDISDQIATFMNNRFRAGISSTPAPTAPAATSTTGPSGR